MEIQKPDLLPFDLSPLFLCNSESKPPLMAALNRFAGARAAATVSSSMLSYVLWKAFSSSSVNSEADLKSSLLNQSSLPLRRDHPKDRNVQWVFLGCPGVGKGTYASRLSSFLGVPHIATGDLVREELSSSGPLASQVWFSLVVN